MSQKILLKRSNVVDSSGNPKLPDASVMDYGELAINYAAGKETISIKNSNDEIVTFKSNNSGVIGNNFETINVKVLGSNINISELFNKVTLVYEYLGHQISHTYIGDDLTFILNPSIEYKVTIQFQTPYYSAEQSSFTFTSQNNNIRNITFVVHRNYVLSINESVSDYSTSMTSSVTNNSSEAIEYIKNNTHRYLGKYVSGDDMMYLCQLDDEDTTKYYENGATASINGSEGDVLVKIPTFYYTAIKNGNIVELIFSKFYHTNFNVWSGNKLIGAFKATYGNNHITSVSGTCGTFNYDYDNFNNGFYCTNYDVFSTLILLFYAYYQHSEIGKQIGNGVSSKITKTGKWLNMYDTTYDNGCTSIGNNFLGLENLFTQYYTEIIYRTYPKYISSSYHGISTVNINENDRSSKNYTISYKNSYSSRMFNSINVSALTSYNVLYTDFSNDKTPYDFYIVTHLQTSEGYVYNGIYTYELMDNTLCLSLTITGVRGENMRLNYIGKHTVVSVSDFKNITTFY